MADIKINADVSAVKKSLQEITQSAKQLGKSPIDLLSPTTVKMLQGEANAQLGELNNKAKTLRSEIEAQARAVEKASRGTRQYASEMKKLVSLSREVAQNQSQIGQMKGVAGAMGGGGGGRRGGMMGGRMGGMMRGLGGLAGGALLGAGGALLGYGASKVMGGIGKYKAGMGERIQMRGMGMDPTMRQSGRAAGLGMDQSALRQARMAGSRAFGAEGGGESATLRRGEYERSFGLDSGTMAGMGGAMRQQVGGKAAAADIEKSLASAVSAGLHDADIGAYLETAVGLLGSIDSTGIKDRAQMLGALADVTRATKDSPEQISRALGGMDQAISGSTGERNAFFQQAFGGRQGMSMGESQFAVEGGLTGLDMGRVAGLSGAQRKQLGGIGGGSQQRAQSILKQFSSQGIDVERLRSGKASKQEQIVAGRFAKQIFGTKTSAEGLGQLGLLSQVAKGGPGGQSAQKKLENARRTIEEKSDAKLGKIANTGEAMLQKLEAIRKINEENIGAAAATYYAKALEFLNMIDKGMMYLAKALGHESDADKNRREQGEEKQKSQHAARIAKGEIAREKLQSGGDISKRELDNINTADRLKKKHSNMFGTVDPEMQSAVQAERGKISKKKIRKEAAPVEGSPLKSTAEKAKTEGDEVPTSAADMLKQINDKLGVANKQRNDNVPLMLQGIRGKKPTNTFGF